MIYKIKIKLDVNFNDLCFANLIFHVLFFFICSKLLTHMIFEVKWIIKSKSFLKTY